MATNPFFHLKEEWKMKNGLDFFNISTDALKDYPDIKCVDFGCDNDLAQYTESMLFDSHTGIAFAKFVCGDKKLIVSLEVNGYVDVEYKDESYKYPSDFPNELRELIKKEPYGWQDNEDVEVIENNWFEYLYGFDCLMNGDVLESDVSDMTPQQIFNEMAQIAIYEFKGEQDA